MAPQVCDTARTNFARQLGGVQSQSEHGSACDSESEIFTRKSTLTRQILPARPGMPAGPGGRCPRRGGPRPEPYLPEHSCRRCPGECSSSSSASAHVRAASASSESSRDTSKQWVSQHLKLVAGPHACCSARDRCHGDLDPGQTRPAATSCDQPGPEAPRSVERSRAARRWEPWSW